MADDVSAGRLHLDVVSDTSGFAREAKAKVDAATKNLRAKVKVELDTRGLVAASRAAAKAASDAAKVRLKAEVDSRGLIAAAREAAAKASAAAKVKIGAEIDQAAFQASLAASVAALSNRYTVKVNVEADTAAAATQLTAFREGQRRLPIEFGANVKMGNVPQFLSQFAKVPLITGAVYALGSAVGQLGGGLIALASSAAQAVQTLAVLPNLVGVLAQAGGVLFASFRGIGDAVTASTEAQKDAGGAATDTAAAQAAAASRVADAQRAIGDAMKAAADSARESARGVRDANYAYRQSILSVRDAREALKNAELDAADRVGDARRAMNDAEESYRKTQLRVISTQNALNQARETAAKRIADVNDQLALAAGREEEASLAVSRAAQNLQDIKWDAAASPQQIAEAELALKSAQNALADTKVSNEELADAAADANAKGVEGSDEVIAAQADIVDAVDAEKDARIDLREFKEDSARADLAQTRAVRDANEALTAALHDQAMAREAIADAERQQRDAAAASTRAIQDAKRNLAEALAAQVAGTQQATAAQVDLNDAMSNLGPNGQAFVNFLTSTVLPRLKDMRLAVQEAFLPFVQEGITRAMPILDTIQAGLMGTVAVLGKFVVKVGELFGSKGFNSNTASIMQTNNVALGFFGDAILSVIRALSNLATVAGPVLLIPFAKWVADIAASFENATTKTDAMRDRLVKARETMTLLKDITGNLIGALMGLGGAAAPTGDQLLQTFDKVSERWENWANSDAGQQRMQQFFQTIRPAFEQMMTLISNLSETFAKLGESGGGPMAAMFKVLNAAVTGLNAVLGTPYLGTAVGWLLTLGGAAGGLALVAGQLMKFGNGIALLGKITGITAMWNAFKGSLLATKIGYYSIVAWEAMKNAAMTTGTFIMGKMRAAMLLVGKAAKFMMGPWGIALIAIVGGLIYAYKHFEGFRKVVDAVMGAVVSAVKWVWGVFEGWYDAMFGHSFIPDMMAGFQVFWGVVKAIFAALGSAVQWVGGVFSWLWNNVISPILPLMQAAFGVWWAVIKVIFEAYVAYVQGIINVIQWLWGNVIQPIFAAMPGAIAAAWAVIGPIFSALVAAVRVIIDVVQWLWDKVIAPGFAAMGIIVGAFWDVARPIFAAVKKIIGEVGDVVGWLWNTIIRPAFAGIGTIVSTWWTGAKIVFEAVKTVVGEVASKFGDLFTKVGSVFSGIQGAIATAWGDENSGIKGILTKIKSFVIDDVAGAFSKIGEGAKSAWDAVKSTAKVPITFVIKDIYNDGIRKMIGFLPGVDTPSEATVPGFAKGGVLPGYTPGRDVHRFYSPSGGALDLSGGEAVMRPEFTKAVGPGWVSRINNAARKGGGALARALAGASGGDPGVDGYGRTPDRASVLRSAMGMVIGAYAKGGTIPAERIQAAQNFAKSKDYALYSQGGATGGRMGPDSYDCSGFMATITNMLTGGGYSGTTSTFPWAGFEPGVGQFTIGNLPGSHMAGTLGGLNVESRAPWSPDSSGGVQIGAAARGYSDSMFSQVYHLGAAGAQAAQNAGPSKAETKAKNKADGWLDSIKGIKDVLGNVGGWVEKMKAMAGDWAGYGRSAVKDVGTKVMDFINDKIPDKIKVPGPVPDIPLPKVPNPFNLFDDGGEWKSGTGGFNASGKTETVFTNENMVDALASIADVAKSLKSMTVDAPTGGSAPLVGELTLVGRDDERPAQFRDAMQALNQIKRGGVHADRPVA